MFWIIYEFQYLLGNDTPVRTKIFRYGSNGLMHVSFQYLPEKKKIYMYLSIFRIKFLLIITHSVSVLPCPDVLCWAP